MSRPALNRRALGLALTRIANQGTTQAHETSSRATGHAARRIGLTGAPGAGKSSLAGRLALQRLHPDMNLGVLAIDPSSPKTGGAILGDRIRMDDLAGSENLYIRSFGSRTSADGLTDNLPELLATMDQFGFDEVILETVGVGQVETASRSQVDTLVLVVPPDAGDVVQAMKAGILEVADIIVINKADMASAGKMATEIERILGLRQHAPGDWLPPVVMTSQFKPESIRALSAAIDRHLHWLHASSQWQKKQIERRNYALLRRMERQLREVLDRQAASFHALNQDEQIRRLLLDLSAQQGKG